MPECRISSAQTIPFCVPLAETAGEVAGEGERDAVWLEGEADTFAFVMGKARSGLPTVPR